MTVGTAWLCNSAEYDQERLLGDALPQRVMGGAACVCVALVCAWTICINLGGGHPDNGAAERADRFQVAASPADRLPVVRLPDGVQPNIDMAAFDSRFSAAFPPGVLSRSAPIETDDWSTPVQHSALAATPDLPRQPGHRLAESAPPAAPRPLAPRWRQHGDAAPRKGQRTTQTVADTPAAPADKPSLLERVFGRAPSAIFAKLFGPSPSGVTLAYAAPEGESGMAGDGASVIAGLYDRKTAVYDIAAHTVYLPNGTALEAHSGLGSRLDDPRYVAERDRGPTPPDMYDLRPRERLFHGVQALRLIPVDEKRVFGRSGLLAHSYMLGPNGQSNGCVSFRDYDAFLQAYENHEITRLAVVSHVD